MNQCWKLIEIWEHMVVWIMDIWLGTLDRFDHLHSKNIIKTRTITTCYLNIPFRSFSLCSMIESFAVVASPLRSSLKFSFSLIIVNWERNSIKYWTSFGQAIHRLLFWVIEVRCSCRMDPQISYNLSMAPLILLLVDSGASIGVCRSTSSTCWRVAMARKHSYTWKTMMWLYVWISATLHAHSISPAAHAIISSLV